MLNKYKILTPILASIAISAILVIVASGVALPLLVQIVKAIDSAPGYALICYLIYQIGMAVSSYLITELFDYEKHRNVVMREANSYFDKHNNQDLIRNSNKAIIAYNIVSFLVLACVVKEMTDALTGASILLSLVLSFSTICMGIYSETKLRALEKWQNEEMIRQLS